MQRAAVLIAPALALTSSLTFAVPAQAAPVDHPTTTTVTAGQHAQTFTVARGVEVPVIDRGTTTIVSYPALVVSGGATVGQTQAALSTVLSAGGDRATIVQTALQYLGDRYVEGGATHAGIDCSGLTMVAYQAVGIQLAHYVPTQDAVATTVSEAEAKPGDLVVYDNGDHVGLFLGDGLVLQAPHPGAPVDVIPMFSAAHHFARVLPAGS
jgi:cell wall-associated NlpC family hydrolase